MRVFLVLFEVFPDKYCETIQCESRESAEHAVMEIHPTAIIERIIEPFKLF